MVVDISVLLKSCWDSLLLAPVSGYDKSSIYILWINELINKVCSLWSSPKPGPRFFFLLPTCCFSSQSYAKPYKFSSLWLFTLKFAITNPLCCLAKLKHEGESHSVMSNSLRSHGVYSPWNPPDQNTRVGSLFLLQRVFQSQRWNPGLLHCKQVLYHLSHQGSPINEYIRISPMAQWVKNHLQCRRHRFDLWLRKFSWKRKWQPTPVFLSGESHGQRSLAGYSSWGHKRVGYDLGTRQH